MISTTKANNLMPSRVKRLLAFVVLLGVIIILSLVTGAVISFIQKETFIMLIFVAIICPFAIATFLVQQEIKNEYGYKIYLDEAMRKLFLHNGLECSKNSIHITQKANYGFENFTTEKEKHLLYLTKQLKITPHYEIEINPYSLIIKFKNERDLIYSLIVSIFEAKKDYAYEDINYLLMGIYYLLNSTYDDKQSRAHICYKNNITPWQVGLANKIEYSTDDLPLIKSLPTNWIEKLFVTQ
jgi:low affinity Fe/Cu permease